MTEVRELTGKPFAVNHTRRPFNEEVFQATLDAGPAVISFALGDPGDLVDRPTTLVPNCSPGDDGGSARIAREAGVDVIIAQGAEAGGFSGSVGTMTLVPQVVDAVAPTPVVAAGGIADGRGLAAALMLGAVGINIGTRFLASTEAAVNEEWKELIVASESEDAVKVEFSDTVVPPLTDGGWPTLPRSLRSPFVDEWNGRLNEGPANADHLRAELGESMRRGDAHRLIPLAGQAAGQIVEVLPVARILQLLVEEAHRALRGRSSVQSPPPFTEPAKG